jgi:peptidoglycan/xylan/chitin deacetylase (PgdA/CDA1 family)
MKINSQYFPVSSEYHIGESYRSLVMILLLLVVSNLTKAQKDSVFAWPGGKQVAISLTFDDARVSQVDRGTALLDQYGVKATFYVVPSSVKLRLDGWRKAVASGHEIGNHSLVHPCTGNFLWSRNKALEDYSLEKMEAELREANDSINILLGVSPESFAFPCGQTFVGRGIHTESYVPIVAQLFSSGRGWLDEGPNDPVFCDFAQLTGIEMDGKEFSDILALIENAKLNHSWLVLAGHEMGDGGAQTTRVNMLRQLLAYVQTPDSGIWIAPVGVVAEYVRRFRK